MATKKSELSKDKIVSMYMDYVLEHNEKPKSVYQFSKLNNITEKEFYNFFGTIESIEKEIFNLFFEKTIALLKKDKDFETYDMRSKLLSFNFTFFELLTANRSYVVMALKESGNQLKSLTKLSNLRKSYIEFVSEIITDEIRTKQEQFQNFQEKAIQESCWFQLLLTIKFWIDDTSKGFEKTDIIIEKSVNTAVDVFNTKPLESLLDLGKFLWKESKMR